MSADAKIWQADEEGWWWKGQHDGDCQEGDMYTVHEGRLHEVVSSVEHCMNASMRWDHREWNNGKAYLAGYIS